MVTVHDLSFLRVPECFVSRFREYLEGAVSRAVSRARFILADSCSTRQDLIELMAVEPERIDVLYPGVEDRFVPIHDAATLAPARVRYRLPERFVLGLGTLQPRKNFDGLVDAFARLLAARGHEPLFADLHLVIAGGKGWLYEEIMDRVERSGVRERVHLLGFVEDRDLPALYNLASVFAFPSWYEGFGVPLLESMACGTPVVSADNSSLPEVVGKAGLLVPAMDAEALASAMARLLDDDQLRDHLVIAGQERTKQFTWETAAQQLSETYSRFRIVNSPKPAHSPDSSFDGK